MSRRKMIAFMLCLVMITILVLGCQNTASAPNDNKASTKYPTKPIHLYINFAAGGSTDMSARILASMLEPYLGVPVVVENKPGGGGSLGPSLIATAQPDGYTIGTITASPVTTLPYTEKLSFHPIDDLTYLCQYTTSHHPIAVSVDSPFNTLDDIIKYARENPKDFSYGTAGALTQANFAMLQLAQAEDVEFDSVPFAEGGSTAMMQMLGGHIDAVVVSDYGASLAAGQIKLIAETGDVKIKGYEDVPTLKELGYDFGSVALVGLVAPPDLPEDVLKTLETALEEVVKDPKFIEEVEKLSTTATYKNSAEFTDYARKAYENTGEMMELLK
ncbi:MAG: tripartite tricarboxylate transporter substrate binding protein [Clostridiaceae bacterium]|nr:tripartite tricarboxylate transporter substrate binding protein [Clostridiaceae bacterium]